MIGWAFNRVGGGAGNRLDEVRTAGGYGGPITEPVAVVFGSSEEELDGAD